MRSDDAGFEWDGPLRNYRSEQAGAAEKFVFITGGAFSEKTQKFLTGVPNQVVEKPNRLNSFRALVQTLVENNRVKGS